ncbi:RNA-guided endonuclease InsQ/TnpB family protein [Streptomyces sp. EAG2]|uniref:RNA-guided endonuclease InsQ/TnpB family protein n=1 Tax=Streptomyces sp. EAG2 TaxID=2056495 RepID=UPI000C6E7CD0|nr:RNA-guided endonuclease TnpB family protein [Streptomyces sp. EAG2]PKR46681.1 transposase [Streptomyces sp. EAG2]
MIRAYKFLLRPTVGQQGALSAMLRDHCTLYNAALQERRDAYRHASKTTVRYGMQSDQLKEIRALDVDGQGRWSFSSQQATLRRLEKAFSDFFRRIKEGRKPGYPRFRSAKRFDTVDFPKDGDGCRWDSTPHEPVTRVRLRGIGHVRVHQHRAVVGRVKTISVKREGKRWYVILSVDVGRPDPLPATGSAVGIDMGINNFLADSSGAMVPNPRFGTKVREELDGAQRALSRCERDSQRRRKAAETLARLHRKVRRQRLDHAHKTALNLVRAHDFIAHEDLRILNMTKRPAPKPVPGAAGEFLPNGAAAKSGLNRAISEVGWGVFLAILAAKAEGAGRQVMAVDLRNTSRRCPACGHTAEENRPTQSRFSCVSCGHTAHADTVGAQNVLRAGLARREAATA